jgi:hypothetical protein
MHGSVSSLRSIMIASGLPVRQGKTGDRRLRSVSGAFVMATIDKAMPNAYKDTQPVLEGSRHDVEGALQANANARDGSHDNNSDQ